MGIVRKTTSSTAAKATVPSTGTAGDPWTDREPAPEPPSEWLDIFDVLAAVQPNDAECEDAFLSRLEDEAAADSQKANLNRVKIGFALLRQQPKKGTNRGQWQVEMGEKLGIVARQVRTYLSAAAELDRARRLEVRVPIQVLDRPLASVASAVRAYAETGTFETAKKAPDRPLLERLQHRIVGVIMDSSQLDQTARWEFMRWSKETLTIIYERGIERPAGEDLAVIKPVPKVLGGYPGSKQGLVKNLVVALNEYVTRVFNKKPTGSMAREVVEPFAGMAAVSRYLADAGIVNRVRLNDANPGIAALLTAISNWKFTRMYVDGGEQRSELVARLLDLPPQTHGDLVERWKRYKAARVKVNEVLSGRSTADISGIHLDTELAFDTLILLHCGYKGLGLTRRPTPATAKLAELGWAGSSSKTGAPQKLNPESLFKRIQDWSTALHGRVVGNVVTCQNAFSVLQEPSWGLAIVDPPYVEDNAPAGRARKGESDLYDLPWGEAEHRRLKEVLLRTRRPWFLTYGDGPLIRALYPASEFDITEVEVKRFLKQGKATKELWIRPSDTTLRRMVEGRALT